MKLSQQMKQHAQAYIQKIYADDFIQQMVHQTLPKEAIIHYLQADTQYLKEFANVYALLLAKVTRTQDKQFLLEQIDFVLNQEVDAHLTLADAANVPYEHVVQTGRWYPAADHYIKHMYYNVYTYGVVETLAAMSPCPWVYRHVAKLINDNHAIDDEHLFKKWIDFYDAPWLDEYMAIIDDMIDFYSQQCTDEQKQRIIQTFVQSCQHERAFFQMAMTQQKWDE